MAKRKFFSSFAIVFTVILLLISALGYPQAKAADASGQKSTLQENVTQTSNVNTLYTLSSNSSTNTNSPLFSVSTFEQNNSLQENTGATSIGNTPQPILNPPLLTDLQTSFLDFFGQNLTATELNNIKLQWAQQNQHNQQVIKDTNGAVLNFSQLDSLYGCYLSNIPAGYTSPYESYGYIQDPDRMIGQIDYNFAYLLTDGWNEHYDPSAMGGESFAMGYMQTYYSGDIYIFAEPGPDTGSNPPWENVVLVCGSNDINTPFLQWIPLGYAVVDNPEHAAWYFVGNTDQQFSCISIMCFTPPRWPDDYPPPHQWPDWFNSVKIDSVYATVSSQCRLSIS